MNPSSLSESSWTWAFGGQDTPWSIRTLPGYQAGQQKDVSSSPFYVIIKKIITSYKLLPPGYDAFGMG